MLVIWSVIHRNKTIKFNSKHDNAIKDSQNDILCTIGYYSAIVIDISSKFKSNTMNTKNPTYTSLGMVL